jgi:predicted transport protein
VGQAFGRGEAGRSEQMSDIKLFRIGNGSAQELASAPVKLEKKVQAMVEKHLETFLHVRFVASEYSTGKTHAGRIDTLGIDENLCPTIIEYKRASNANVINQGLFYLDWLMDHKAEFELLVQKAVGQEQACQIDWSGPRLLCLAEDFTRYDIHAIQQINRNIELIRYSFFGGDLLLLDLVNVVSADPFEETDGTDRGNGNGPRPYTTQEEYLARASSQLKELYQALVGYVTDLGEDVQVKPLKLYFACKRMKNFATFQLQTRNNSMLMWLPLSPEEVALKEGFSRDVRGVGHHGTGDVELTIRNLHDLEKAKPLIQRSFEEN